MSTINAKHKAFLSTIDRMARVISYKEKIPYKKLKANVFFDYIFITDGCRIFKLILPKKLAKYFSQRDVRDVSLENNEGYLSRISYKEILFRRIKIYVGDDDAKDFIADGSPIYRTPNGSRTGFNHYFIWNREYIIEDAKDISEL